MKLQKYLTYRRSIIFAILLLVLVYEIFFKAYYYNSFFSGITSILFLPAYILALIIDTPICSFVSDCRGGVSPVYFTFFLSLSLILAWVETVLLDKFLPKFKFNL